MLVVDDSPLIRQVVRDIVDAAGDFEVVGEAADGHAARRMVRALSPDLVTLDVQMPGLDGLATLGYLMREAPRPVVMLSALGDGGDTTMRALELGAVDFVRKPGAADALDLATLSDRLVGALRAAAGARLHPMPVLARPVGAGRAGARAAPGARVGTSGAPRPAAPTHVVIIAASTGGPRALAEIVPSLAIGSAAVVIAQHMPAGFTESFARRLDALAPVPVCEAMDAMPLAAGQVYVAPGGMHTTIDTSHAGLQLSVRPGLPVHGVAPAADPLLCTAASAFGPRTLAVILTGMGQDGARGARAVRDAGGLVVVQDAITSVVFGMPQAAMALAGADAVAPLRGVAEAVADGLRARGCDPRSSDAPAATPPSHTRGPRRRAATPSGSDA